MTETLTDKERERREKKNAYRRTEEYNAKRRATRDLSKDRERWKKYYEANREYLLQKDKEYRERPEVKEYRERPEVKEHYKELRRQEYLRNSKQKALDGIKTLSDKYVKNVLTNRTNLSYKDIPKEMIEVKRLEMLIRREYLKNTPEQERRKIYKERYLARKRKLLTEESQNEKRN